MNLGSESFPFLFCASELKMSSTCWMAETSLLFAAAGGAAFSAATAGATSISIFREDALPADAGVAAPASTAGVTRVASSGMLSGDRVVL